MEGWEGWYRGRDQSCACKFYALCFFDFGMGHFCLIQGIFVFCFYIGLCTETDSKDCDDSCCICSVIVFAKIIPVYSFLCAGMFSVFASCDVEWLMIDIKSYPIYYVWFKYNE